MAVPALSDWLRHERLGFVVGDRFHSPNRRALFGHESFLRSGASTEPIVLRSYGTYGRWNSAESRVYAQSIFVRRLEQLDLTLTTT